MLKYHHACFVVIIFFVFNLGCHGIQNKKPKEIETPSGLTYYVVQEGKGNEVVEGNAIKIKETVSYRNGKELYTTKGMDNHPIFNVGEGHVVEGLDEGVRGMKVGEIRLMTIPPKLSIRSQYPDFMSPDSILIYDVELIEIKKVVKPNRRTGLDLMQIGGGTFTMGGIDDADDGGDNIVKLADECPHEVTIDGFLIAKYEVTQADWIEVMGQNPSQNKGCLNCPVEQVSWYDVQSFIKKANVKYHQNYRLPTEEEWEFAASGGNRSPSYSYAGSQNPWRIGWYNKNAEGTTHPVGELESNHFGLHDMSGNVLEWCQNLKWPYPCDKIGKSFDTRVVRGGAFGNRKESLRIIDRSARRQSIRLSTIGFRLAKDLE